MKKISIVLMAAVMVLSSCGGGKKKAQQNADATKAQAFEQVQLEANIQMQLDSIAGIFADKMPMPVGELTRDGKIVLSDKEKQIKPSYLVDPKSVTETATLSQKYRAFAMLGTDQMVAGLYDMSTADYEAAIKKVASEINDPAFKQIMEAKDLSAEKVSALVKSFYADEVKNGRINLFWEMMGSLMIENMYVVSQNVDKFMPLFTDEDASNFTLRIFLIKQSVDQLVAYYPELESMSKSLEPLCVLNAMDVAEFKDQLLEMKGQLEVVRAGLLK